MRALLLRAAVLLGLGAALAFGLLAAPAVAADPTSGAVQVSASGPLASTDEAPVETPALPGQPGLPGDQAQDEQPPAEREPGPRGTNGPRGAGGPDEAADDSLTIDLGGMAEKPSSSVTILIALTLLSLLPAILLTCTSFTKILIVLGLTRNALGLQQTPPNQVLAGLALFLSLFIMTPTLSEMNEAGVQPYLDGDKKTAQAYTDGVEPLREFMLGQAGDEELKLLTDVADRELPASRSDIPMSTLVPAFILSELKQAFIIGFIIFIPFLVIDIVVSGALMALGMMMMPPVMVSLPFKLLLFVLVDGWGLIIKSLVASYQ